MLDSIGYGLLNLGVLLSIIAYIVHLREKKKTEYNFSRVYIVSTITSLSLWSSLALLTALFATSDYSVIAVFQNSDNSMSLTQRIMATWASRQGVMILWASIMSTISIFAIRTVKDELNNFVEYRFTSITLFFNALIALFTMSVRDPRPFESFSSMIPTDGQGLTPSLLSFWQQIHPPIAFLAYSSFIVPYAFGIASLSYQRAQHKPSVVLTKLNDFFILLGWGTTTLFIIAGSIWGYEENWAGFWNWDPVEVAALVMWTSATLYFHVKSQVSDNHALRYSTAALGWISVAFASFIVRSGLLRGLHSYLGVNIPQTIVFGTLLVGSLLTLLWALRQSGMELFPEYLYNLKSHSNKPRFLTFWVLTAMLLANVVGLLVQIYNSIAFDFHEYPYEFYVYINGILLFLLGVLLVYCEIDFERFSRDTIHRVWLGLSIVFGILLYFLLIDTILTTIFVAILTSAFLILLWDFGIDARSRNFRKARLKITHILVVLMIISYISVDY
ncbi:MAG: cytochrome c biogenesis protein CcsA, partial [Candidatus Kariarchaeaceae archaeon]